jgi:hypothetical protein
MYNCETRKDESSPYEALGLGSGYELTEKQKIALSAPVKIALGISSEAMRKPFEEAPEITATLTEITQLDHDEFVESNRELHRLGYTALFVDPKKSQEIWLLLTEKGEKFLEESITKAINPAAHD